MKKSFHRLICIMLVGVLSAGHLLVTFHQTQVHHTNEAGVVEHDYLISDTCDICDAYFGTHATPAQIHFSFLFYQTDETLQFIEISLFSKDLEQKHLRGPPTA